MIDREIMESVNRIWAVSDEGRVVNIIWPILDGRRTVRLFKLQKGVLGTIIGVVIGHCRRIGLGHFANEFYRTCRVEEEEETFLHLLGTCSALCQRRKRHRLSA